EQAVQAADLPALGAVQPRAGILALTARKYRGIPDDQHPGVRNGRFHRLVVRRQQVRQLLVDDVAFALVLAVPETLPGETADDHVREAGVVAADRDGDDVRGRLHLPQLRQLRFLALERHVQRVRRRA